MKKIKELIKTFKKVDKSFMLFKKVHFYTFSICWKVELCFAKNRQLFHVGRIYFLFKSIRNMKIWESRCVEPSQNLREKKTFFKLSPLYSFLKFARTHKNPESAKSFPSFFSLSLIRFINRHKERSFCVWRGNKHLKYYVIVKLYVYFNVYYCICS